MFLNIRQTLLVMDINITKQYAQHQLFFFSTFNSAVIIHNTMCHHICVKPSTSEDKSYFLSFLKDPPTDSTRITSVSHHHHLGYICYYLTAEHKVTQ
jgi:hypothetical protein